MKQATHRLVADYPGGWFEKGEEVYLSKVDAEHYKWQSTNPSNGAGQWWASDLSYFEEINQQLEND